METPKPNIYPLRKGAKVLEKVFREISKSELTDAQKGQLLTMSLQYLDFGEITSDDLSLNVYFMNNIAKQIDKLKNDRIRKGKKNNENQK